MIKYTNKEIIKRIEEVLENIKIFGFTHTHAIKKIREILENKNDN